MSPAELNGILRKCFAEVKTNKKTDLTPSALTGIRAAIHRAITGQPISRSINIQAPVVQKVDNSCPADKSLSGG